MKLKADYIRELREALEQAAVLAQQLKIAEDRQRQLELELAQFRAKYQAITDWMKKHILVHRMWQDRNKVVRVERAVRYKPPATYGTEVHK